MVDILVTETLRAQGADEAAAIVRATCEPLPSPDDAVDFGARFDHFGDAKVILLGEATHGTSQFYRARAAITRRLIEKHGFSIGCSARVAMIRKQSCGRSSLFGGLRSSAFKLSTPAMFDVTRESSLLFGISSLALPVWDQ